MTEKAQRIAIAKVRGWRQSTMGNRSCFDPEGLSTYWDNAPDYPNDLNAMHEAEMSQVDQEDGHFIMLFREHLHTILGHDGTMAIHATAPQRAEAFLRTLNLWDETK